MSTNVDLPDFIALRSRLDSTALSNGDRAALRRVDDLDALELCPALYKLFPGQRPHTGHLRLAFLLPFCQQNKAADSIGAQLAREKVSESRILQVARSKSPMDMIQLRRLLTHVEPAVNWSEFGKALWYWNARSRRQFVEDYYLKLYTSSKGVAL